MVGALTLGHVLLVVMGLVHVVRGVRLLAGGERDTEIEDKKVPPRSLPVTCSNPAAMPSCPSPSPLLLLAPPPPPADGRCFGRLDLFIQEASSILAEGRRLTSPLPPPRWWCCLWWLWLWWLWWCLPRDLLAT